MTSNPSLAALNDQVLLSQFTDLVRQDREGKANLLRHIDAIDRRKLWARFGHPSLFDFLVTRHHMSEATAFKRIGAARTARRFTAAILDRALDAFLTEVQKRKIGITDKPRAPREAKPPSGRQTRHLQASARREVWPRDEGRCGFVGEDGHRCNETRGLQFAHKEPWAKGGTNTSENLCLRCRLCRMRHNQ